MSLSLPRILSFFTTVALVRAMDVDDHVSIKVEGEDGRDSLINAHGVIGCLAWLLLIFGAILMHFLSGSRTWLVHASMQAVGVLLFVIGTGTGIHLAMTTGLMGSAHAAIGLLLFASIWLVACGGILQHLAFQTYKRKTPNGYAHMWGARGLITLAFINGGLGLALADEGANGKLIAYGVVAGVLWLAWIGVALSWPTGLTR